MNVFWLALTATTHVVDDLKSVVDSMVTDYGTDFFAYSSNTWHITEAKASWLYAAGNSLEYAGSYSIAGATSGTLTTDAVCAVINWSIPDFYRGGHPRTYLGGIDETLIMNGRQLTSTTQTNLAAGATTWMGHVNALTHGGISAVALGTVRFASGNAWLSPPVFRAYQGAGCRSVLGTQRRRYAA